MPNLANTDGISVIVTSCISDVQNVSDLVSVPSSSSLAGFLEWRGGEEKFFPPPLVVLDCWYFGGDIADLKFSSGNL